MKILLMSVRADYGGGPKHIQQLIENLPDDIELYMAYPFDNIPYGDIWNQHKRIKKRFNLPYRKFSLFCLIRLGAFIIKNNIDIVHSHGNGAGIYSRLLPFIGVKAKIIHTFHGISEHYSSKIKGMLNTILARILRRTTDVFILVSKGEYKLGEERRMLVTNKSYIIYNGIDPPSLKLVDHQGLNIVTMSRFDYQKNMDFCYNIASRFKQDKTINFIWVGDGDNYERLKLKAQQENLNIKFVGFSAIPMEYLANSNIYLSTSRFEGLPYALIEATSIGLPIVATNVNGNNEVVIHGYNGFLFSTEDEAVTYIESLLDDASLRNRMSENGCHIYRQCFTTKVMIAKITDIYRQVI